VILNGLLIGNHDTILAAYDPPFSHTNIAKDNPMPLRFLAKCATVELAYLKNIDNQHFKMLSSFRPFNEYINLYGEVRALLTKKILKDTSGKESKSPKNTDQSYKQQAIILQKVKRRMDILSIEIQEIDKQIKKRQNEKTDLDKHKEELIEKKEKIIREKGQVESKLINLNDALGGYKKEDDIQNDLGFALENATEKLIEIPNKEFTEEILGNNFFKSKVGGIYSILFCEVFEIEVAEKLTLDELSVLSETTLEKKRCANYIKEFTKIIENPEKYKSMIREFKPESLSEEMTHILCNIVEVAGLHVMNKFHFHQQLLTKWIDMAVESSKFALKRDERYLEVTKLEGTQNLVREEISKRNKLLSMIDGS
jgi:hypothetical protein